MAWSSAYITALPDSAFACVDDTGRHYPHHDAAGKLDLPHLRNALSRLGDESNTQCGAAHIRAHAKAAGVGESKAAVPMKATLLDDDAFRLLALPFGGPIPFPGAPRGADLDRQWLSERTDFGAPPKRVPVTWHHGLDRVMGKAELGEAGDLEFDDDGGWVTVWMKHGERRVSLIQRLADAGAKIFGSSEAIPGTGRLRKGETDVPWRRSLPGEITRWHYAGQTLSTSPQNTASILVPVKATLTDLADGVYVATPDYFDDLARWLDDLAPDPAPTRNGDGEAKAGRVLASRNEARLREALAALDSPYDATFQVEEKRRKQAVDAIKSVLDELTDRYLRPVEL